MKRNVTAFEVKHSNLFLTGFLKISLVFLILDNWYNSILGLMAKDTGWIQNY